MSSEMAPLGYSRESALMAVSVALPVLQRSYRAAADKAVAHLGLSQALAWPLVMIGRQGDGLRQGVLADLLGIEGPSLVRSLDQLVAADLVERREDAADRRAKTLHLTPQGAATRAQIETVLHALRAALYGGASDVDVAACLRVFGVLERSLGCTMPTLPAVPALAVEPGKP
ncbi:MAG TPA: MarR family transcriptional regulator [Burkholderiaceae bacterium]